jgi:hypothetical protein
VVDDQSFRDPGMQALLVGIPGGQGQQHRDWAAGVAAGQEVQQQPNQQHGLACPGVAEHDQPAGGHPCEHRGQVSALAGKPGRGGGPACQVGWVAGPALCAGGDCRPVLDHVGVGRHPGDRERVGLVEPTVGGLGLPLHLDCDGELIGNLCKRQITGAGGGLL